MTRPTTTAIVAFQIHPIPADVLDQVRARGVDAVSGTPVEHLVADGGEPLRCCLRDASPGEEAILFGYEPPLPTSPYREIGAVFAHAESCPGPNSTQDYPRDWRGRPQVLRAYDMRGWIHEASRTHDGQDPERVIATMLANPDVTQIHSRNIVYGCYMFTITRPADPPAAEGVADSGP
jgi:hypothetical protein